MPPLSPSFDAVSQIGRAAHDLGLAGLLGGNLFGRMALHPAVAGISDKGERGKVVNEVALVAVKATLTQRQHRRAALRRWALLLR